MMARLKKFLLSPRATVLAFMVAAGLLLFSTVGGARAALTYFSETYSSRVQLSDIGVTLVENGSRVSWQNSGEEQDAHTGELLTKLLAEGEELRLSKPYEERITVSNSGTINQYIRVSLYRYWLDENGNKLQNLSPETIDLHLVNLGGDWLEDEAAATPERTVLYYSHLLRSGEESAPLSDTLSISGDVAVQTAERTMADGTVQTVYEYNGAKFVLEARVDAVQENNAQAAALSAWGREVAVDEAAGTLSLR